MEDKVHDFFYKVVLLGDSGVGKTSLLLRYCENTFDTNFVSTIGIDFKVKTVLVDGKKVKLQIWDTAGQERFRYITTSYLRGAMGVILVYDITNLQSFENIARWQDTILKSNNGGIPIVVAGNKCDCFNTRAVNQDQVNKLTTTSGIPCFETSAKTGNNVQEVVEALIKEIMKAGIKSKTDKDIVDMGSTPSHCSC